MTAVNIIGKGNFAIVNEVEIDGKKYAQKKLKQVPDEYNNKERVERFTREINLLLQFDHPNIIKIIKYDSNEYYYIMDKYPHTLASYLQLYPIIGENYDQINNIMFQLIQAVKYCHSQGVKHRDIKPENILINDKNELVLCDFGIAMQEIYENDNKLTTIVQGFDSGAYTASEVRNQAGSINEAADIYSLGKILQYLLLGDATDCSWKRLEVKESLKSLIEEATENDPDRRIQTSQVFEAKYLFEINEFLSKPLDEMKLMINVLNVEYNEELLNELITLLYQLDDDIRFYTVIALCTKSLIINWHADSKESLMYSMERYAKHIQTDGFFCSFEETDNIAHLLVCYNELTTNTDLKADILFSLVKIAYRYNRFKVMRDVLEMISTCSDDKDIVFQKVFHNQEEFKQMMSNILKEECYFSRDKINTNILNLII